MQGLKPAAKAGVIDAGGRAMITHQYVSKAAQGGAQPAGMRARYASGSKRFRRWFLQRGVLYGLTQTPMIALMVGFIF